MSGNIKIDMLLYDQDVRDRIEKDNIEQFDLAFIMQQKVEEMLIPIINDKLDIKHETEDDEKLDYIIHLLLAQAIKTYKSCVVLASEGYLVNMFINLRNLIEITFKSVSILDTDIHKGERIKKYLDQTDNGVMWKAYESLEVVLYDIYETLCNFIHANYSATSRNLTKDGISISPESEEMQNAIILMNSIYYHYIEIICNKKNFDIGWDEISLPDSISSFVKAFNTHRNVVDLVSKYIPGMTNEEFRKQYSDWYKEKKKEEEKQEGKAKKKTGKTKKKVNKILF